MMTRAKLSLALYLGKHVHVFLLDVLIFFVPSRNSYRFSTDFDRKYSASDDPLGFRKTTFPTPAFFVRTHFARSLAKHLVLLKSAIIGSKKHFELNFRGYFYPNERRLRRRSHG
jgi:hypothetical protein